MKQNKYDVIIVGSGFGGSVSALRLAEKGYNVLVLEKGKRYEDKDFPKTNWNLKKYNVAEDCWFTAVEIIPENAFVWSCLGDVRRHNNSYNEALLFYFLPSPFHKLLLIQLYHQYSIYQVVKYLD